MDTAAAAATVKTHERRGDIECFIEVCSTASNAVKRALAVLHCVPLCDPADDGDDFGEMDLPAGYRDEERASDINTLAVVYDRWSR